MLQARGREMAKVLLIGMLNGTLPVTIRQKQSIPLLVRFLSAPQQPAVGEVPLAAVLFVRKFMHGVKVASAEAVHAVLIWP
jgi:hypothetical protein